MYKGKLPLFYLIYVPFLIEVIPVITTTDVMAHTVRYVWLSSETLSRNIWKHKYKNIFILLKFKYKEYVFLC